VKTRRADILELLRRTSTSDNHDCEPSKNAIYRGYRLGRTQQCRAGICRHLAVDQSACGYLATSFNRNRREKSTVMADLRPSGFSNTLMSVIPDWQY